MNRRAFTLVELLVVIGVIAILIAAMLPALGVARSQSRSVQCLSNLRQMMVAATIYQSRHGGRFPIASYAVNNPPVFVTYNWDFITTRDSTTGLNKTEPGLLWQGQTVLAVQQCPAFEGVSVGFGGDPFTGYNYNTSYIGREMSAGIIPVPPARASQVRKPAQTAVFGDGEYSAGANKFMRSPFASPGEAYTGGRFAGTQGYRHRGRTNVAFADGHAESLAERFTRSSDADVNRVSVRTGFLSADNSMYDLD